MLFVIPVFIPHQGCPHSCIFCNQRVISGHVQEKRVSPKDVKNTIEEWLKRSPAASSKEVQVAFYGGSFTGLPFPRQAELLDAVVPFVKEGKVSTIRLSTRPDYIDRQTIRFLHEKCVGTVELGVQSLDDRVLEASRRGHTADQSIDAVRLLQKGGLLVGVQLMVGLPGQTGVSLMTTARKVAGLKPDFVRIYPVLVVRGSRLADRYEEGMYHPLTLDQAVAKSARIKRYFDEHRIKTVRMGLQAGPELEENLLAGPYHPAFGEMVNSRLMFRQTRKLLAGLHGKQKAVLTINGKDMSVFRGIRSVNIQRLNQLGLADSFILQTDARQPRLSVRMAWQTAP